MAVRTISVDVWTKLERVADGNDVLDAWEQRRQHMRLHDLSGLFNDEYLGGKRLHHAAKLCRAWGERRSYTAHTICGRSDELNILENRSRSLKSEQTVTFTYIVAGLFELAPRPVVLLDRLAEGGCSLLVDSSLRLVFEVVDQTATFRIRKAPGVRK